MSSLWKNMCAKFHNTRRYIATIAQLVRLVWQASPVFFIISCSLTFLNALLPVANIFIISRLLQTLVEATHSQAKSGLFTTFILLLLFMAGIDLVMGVLQRLNVSVQRLHQTRVTNHVQLLIAKKASELDLANFEDSEFQNRMQTSANEASYRIPMFLDRLMIMGASSTIIFSLAVVILLWQIWIIPVIVFASLAMFWVSTHFGTKRVNIITQRAETERKKAYLSMLLTSEQAAKEIRVFGLQSFLLSAFRNMLETIYGQDRQLAFCELSYMGAAVALLATIQPALFAFTAFQALQGTISIGQFSLYTQSIAQFESTWTQLISIQSLLHENNLFASYLFDFLATQPQVEAKHLRSKTSLVPLSQTPYIEFRHVSFCYPGTTYAVVKDVSFIIQPGEAIALVGKNGSGKTTLIKLLAGLYEPTEGHIFLDGVDIQTLERDELRAKLSMIFQDYTIYHFTARENIGLGQVNMLADFNQIEKAARRSALDQVIEELPNKYETVLGRLWKKGHELSGGQRQLVALTRSLLRNAPILILDEPSAALDIYSEQHFFQQLLEDRTGGQLQTVIFVSHRFTSVRRADRILVLEHGLVTEQGTHEELIARGRSYTEMFNLQAALYTSPVEASGVISSTK